MGEDFSLSGLVDGRLREKVRRALCLLGRLNECPGRCSKSFLKKFAVSTASVRAVAGNDSSSITASELRYACRCPRRTALSGTAFRATRETDTERSARPLPMIRLQTRKAKHLRRLRVHLLSPANPQLIPAGPKASRRTLRLPIPAGDFRSPRFSTASG